MKCPIDGASLVMTERQGIEIDYCPQCRGVWLDRGELDKLVERSVPEARGHGPSHESPRGHHAQPHGYPQQHHDHRYGEPPRHHGHHGDHGYHKHKKRGSWIGELFDFD